MNFRIFLTLLAIATFVSTNAQNAKIKKKMAYVDDVLYLDLQECKAVHCVFRSLSGKDLLVLNFESFQQRHPHASHRNYKGPEMQTVHYVIIKFLDFELEFEAHFSKKSLVEAMHKEGLVDGEGNISEEAARKFARKYGKDISGNRPLEIIITD